MEPIFALIKSLSQSEKRYFVLFSKFQTTTTTTSYLALFNRIVKMEAYNEKDLKKEFGAVHFAQLKKLLFKKLLQALRLYYSTTNSQNEIFTHIHNYKLLASRGIQTYAEKELKRAEHIAREAELNYELAIVFKERNLLINGMSDAEELQSRIKENELFFQKQIAYISNEHEYEQLFLEIELVNKQLESTRNKEEMNRVTNFLQQPLLQSENSALSIQSKILFHFSKGLAYYLLSDYSNCYVFMKQSAELLEQNESILAKQEDLYVRALANQCLSAIHLQKEDEYVYGLEKLKKVKLSDTSTEASRDYIVYILQLMFFNKKKNYTRALQWIDDHEPFAKEMDAKMDRLSGMPQEKVYSVFQKAIAFVGNNMHKKASQVINEFIGKKGKSMKEDAYITARIFFLFIRFELNDESLIESELRSVQRYLKEKNKLFLFEKHMLQFITRMLIATSAQEKKNNFLKLKEELIALKEIEFEKNAFTYFDFSDWVDRCL